MNSKLVRTKIGPTHGLMGAFALRPLLSCAVFSSPRPALQSGHRSYIVRPKYSYGV